MSMKKILFAFAVFATAQHTYAQKDSTQNILDEVVVTATKSPKKLSETGKVLTVITREQLERSAGKDIAQLLNEQAGITVNGANSNPGKDKSIYLRGAKNEYTLILLDGIPVYDPSGIGSNYDFRLIPVENIDRIEILKGSQSTLYGSDAIAGVINIITRKNGNKPIGAFANLSYGTYETLKANAGIRGNTGIFDYNVAYTYYDTKGISEAVDKNNAGNFDKDGYTQHALLANLGFKISNNWKLSPYLRYSKFDGNIDYDAFADDKDYTYNSSNTQAGLRNEFKFGKSTLTVNYNYNTAERNYFNDSGNVSMLAYDKFLKGGYKGTEHFAEGIIATPLTTNLQLVAGVDYRSANTAQSYLSISDYYTSESEIGKDSAKQNQYNVYASLLYNGKILHADAGMRYNHHSAYGSNVTYNFNPFVFIHNEVKVFANISSAFKTPTLYQLYVPGYGNKNLTPETAITYEGGVQYINKKQIINARAVVFKRDVKDAIAFFFNPLTFESLYINQDKQEDWGLEIESSIQLTKQLQLQLNYAHVDGEITTKNNGKDTTYFNLFRRPKDNWGISLNYQATKALFVSVNLRGYGKRTDLDFSTYPTSYVELSNYVLLNAYAEYKINTHVKLFADVKNITDKKYTEVLGYSTQGANVQAGLSVNF
ncbi:TonB-dependent receptor [soil metagenome]